MGGHHPQKHVHQSDRPTCTSSILRWLCEDWDPKLILYLLACMSNQVFKCQSSFKFRRYFYKFSLFVLERSFKTYATWTYIYFGTDFIHFCSFMVWNYLLSNLFSEDKAWNGVLLLNKHCVWIYTGRKWKEPSRFNW